MTRPGIGVVGRRLVQFLLDELLVFLPMLLLAIAVVWLFRPHGPAGAWLDQWFVLRVVNRQA